MPYVYPLPSTPTTTTPTTQTATITRSTYYRLYTSPGVLGEQIYQGEYNLDTQTLTAGTTNTAVSIGTGTGQAALFDASQWGEPQRIAEQGIRLAYGSLPVAGFTQPAVNGDVAIGFTTPITDPYTLEDIQNGFRVYGVDANGLGGAYQIQPGGTVNGCTLRNLGSIRGSVSSSPGVVIGPATLYLCSTLDYPRLDHPDPYMVSIADQVTNAFVRFHAADPIAEDSLQDPQSEVDILLLQDRLVRFAFRPQPLNLESGGETVAEAGEIYIYNPADFPNLLMHALINEGPRVRYRISSGPGTEGGPEQTGTLQNLGTQILPDEGGTALVAVADRTTAIAGQAIAVRPKHVYAHVFYLTGRGTV